MKKEFTKESLQAHMEHIIGLTDEIKVGKVTILTGRNGSGKSLIRKIVSQSISKQLGKDEKTPVVASTSQEQRTTSRPDWSALSSCMHDLDSNPTSVSTLNLIQQVISLKDRFLVIDEPEIGMGEETLMGVINLLNEKFNPLPTDIYGVLIITHSRLVVENLKSDFLNIEGMNREEWLNRKIVPADLEEVEDWSLELFRTIQNRINDNKNKK
jgi:ABC-type ATPase involved in cell division